MEFCYWKLRGLGQSIRLLLEYVGEPYTDKSFGAEGADQWFAKKNDLGFDFPNLPYLIDGDKKVTQSGVIMMYLGKKFGLAGSNDDEFIRIAEVHGALRDIKLGLGRISYSADYEKLRPDFMPKFFAGIKNIAKFLGDKKFLMG